MSSYESVQSIMADTDQARVRPARGFAGFVDRAMRVITCTAARLRESWRARRAYDAFSRLDNHMLADIGTNRADMFVAAYAEDHGCSEPANSNEPQGPHAANTQGVA